MADETSTEVVATHVDHEIALDVERPAPEWQSAAAIVFDRDWQGLNPDPQRSTEVRILWSVRTLFLRFACHYRELNLFNDAGQDGRRMYLWERDVVEAFLQPDPSQERYYKEFEVSPNGMWIDLDISPSGWADLKSGVTRAVWLDEAAKRWSAEIAIPIAALTPQFDPLAIWRVNFYRVEGKVEPRTYMAWQPTHTSTPNFHVPGAFGRLTFAPR